DFLFLLEVERVVPGHAQPPGDKIQPRRLRSGRMYLATQRPDARVKSLRRRFEHADQRPEEAVRLLFIPLIDSRQIRHQSSTRIKNGQLRKKRQARATRGS